MEAHRLLLVDDEPSLRLTLAANLEREGFEVLEAAWLSGVGPGQVRAARHGRDGIGRRGGDLEGERGAG